MAISRKKYPPGWRKRSREYRRQVANNRCEHCGVKHGTVEAIGPDLRSDYPATRIRYIWVHAAHKYHDKTRMADEDLRALCDRCHAYYDLDDILAKKEYGLQYAGPHQLNLFTSTTA